VLSVIATSNPLLPANVKVSEINDTPSVPESPAILSVDETLTKEAVVIRPCHSIVNAGI